MSMSDFKKLSEKYWMGESDLKEDKMLSELIKDKDTPKDDREFFSYLEHKRNEKLNNPNFEQDIIKIFSKHKALIFKRVISIAASIVILIGVGSYFITKENIKKHNIANTSTQDTFSNPSEAYLATKEALLMVSANLNKGKAYSQEIAKFNQSQEKLKN